jgi:hypothetical protein
MTLMELRQNLEEVLGYVKDGATAEAVRKIEETLQDLDETCLVTIAEASKLLSIRSPLIVELVLRREGVPILQRGEAKLIPLAEIDRVRDSERVRMIQASDRVHDSIEDFGSPNGLSEDELEMLQQSRPGTLPWER